METSGRHAKVERQTSESQVSVEINLDGRGISHISTGVGFFDHMLTALSTHSLIDMDIVTTGDLHIDGHHSIEDTAIVFGLALREALGDKKGIRRFGFASVPLDESLAQCTVDVAGRPYCVMTGEPEGQIYARIGGNGVSYAGSMTYHVMEAIAFNSGLCLHLDVIRGRDPHHIVEAQFKAFARALREAVEYDPRRHDIPSTKGSL